MIDGIVEQDCRVEIIQYNKVKVLLLYFCVLFGYVLYSMMLLFVGKYFG